jgi:hypothetical protein
MFSIDRKSASRLLKISVRTVDRYIKSGKLPSEQREGRIWLNKSDVTKLKTRRGVWTSVDTMGTEMSIDNKGSSYVGMSIDNGNSVSIVKGVKRASKANITGESVYQKLFEELQAELKEKQERLEGANYRVGQLEGILKENIPRLEHNRLLLMERAEKQEIQIQHESLKIEYDHTREKLRDEKLSKRVFLIFLFIIMLLQPLWLVLSLRS